MSEFFANSSIEESFEDFIDVVCGKVELADKYSLELLSTWGSSSFMPSME